MSQITLKGAEPSYHSLRIQIRAPFLRGLRGFQIPSEKSETSCFQPSLRTSAAARACLCEPRGARCSSSRQSAGAMMPKSLCSDGINRTDLAFHSVAICHPPDKRATAYKRDGLKWQSRPLPHVQKSLKNPMDRPLVHFCLGVEIDLSRNPLVKSSVHTGLGVEVTTETSAFRLSGQPQLCLPVNLVRWWLCLLRRSSELKTTLSSLVRRMRLPESASLYRFQHLETASRVRCDLSPDEGSFK